MNNKKLTRSNDKKLAGICAGFAEYFEIDPTIIRAAFALLCVVTGIIPCLIVYLLLYFIVPEK